MILVRRQPVCVSYFEERFQRIHPSVMATLVLLPRAVSG